MKNREKLFSLLMALCMVLSLMPWPIASAANESKTESTYTAAVMPSTASATPIATAVEDADESEPESTYTPAVMPDSVGVTGTLVATGNTLLSIGHTSFQELGSRG